MPEEHTHELASISICSPHSALQLFPQVFSQCLRTHHSHISRAHSRCRSHSSLPPHLPLPCSIASPNQRHVFFLQHCDNFLLRSPSVSHLVSQLAFASFFCCRTSVLLLFLLLLLLLSYVWLARFVVFSLCETPLPLSPSPCALATLCFCVKCLICLSSAERMQPLRKYVQPVSQTPAPPIYPPLPLPPPPHCLFAYRFLILRIFC